MNWKLIRVIDRIFGIPLIQTITHFSAPRTRSKDSFVTPQRILLIKFWGIGNLFMSLPSIQALRTTWPDATIDFLTLENNQSAVKITGAADTVISIDTNSPIRFITTCLTSLKILRNNRYDLVVDFEQFARFSALISTLVRAPRTIGFETSGQFRHTMYTDPVPYNNDIHITRSFYTLVEKAGVTTPFNTAYTLPDLASLQQQGKTIAQKHTLSAQKPFVIIHIGTSDNFKERRWPPYCYAELCNRLTESYDLQIVLTGLADEQHLTAETVSFLKNNASVLDLAGRLSFREYFQLISISSLVVSADTAAVHIASVLDIPVVGLYGPNTPALYGPWGTQGHALYAGFDCSPCITNFNSKINTCCHPDGRGACMNALSIEHTFTSIQKLLNLPQVQQRLTTREEA